MANNPNNERTEREFALDVNQAVANTEMEIFDEAMGDDPLDNDGDTSLEEMGEGLEGEDLDEEEEEQPEAEAAPKEQQDEQEEEEQPEEEPQEAAAERPEPRIPPSRLREEADARRQLATENAQLRQQMAEMQGRMTEISARVNAPKVEQPPQPPPDMFADPEGHQRYIINEAERRAQAKIDQARAEMRQEMAQQERQRNVQRAEWSFDQMAKGDDSLAFHLAYGHLLRTGQNDGGTAVQRIMNAPDPGRELISWWNENGGQDYLQQQGLARPPQRSQRQPQQPRHETRLPPTLRSPPSLNSVPGGQRQQTADPEMFDDSDEATFRFATRR